MFIQFLFYAHNASINWQKGHYFGWVSNWCWSTREAKEMCLRVAAVWLKRSWWLQEEKKKKKKLLVALSSYLRFTRRKRIRYSCLKLDTELCWNQKSVPVARQLQEYKWMSSFSCYVSLFIGGFAVDSYMPLLMDVDKTEHNLWD